MPTPIGISGINLVNATRAVDTNLVAKAAATPVVARDTSQFINTFDASKVVGVFRPTRTLVVGQDPAAGTFIPVGTTVDLIVTVKDAIPLDGLKNIDPKVLEKFSGKNVGDVLSTLNGTEAQKVLDRGDTASYETLSTADKSVVNDYIKTTYGVDAAADPAGAQNVYSNVKFLNGL
jgi:hypothetical protein